MAIVLRMLHEIIRGGTTQERVNAVATLIMWFAAGAFVTSTLAKYIIPHHSGTPTDLIGGAVVAVTAIIFKAT